MGIFYAISWIFEGIELLFSGLAAIEPIDINIIDADDQKSIAAFVFSYSTVCGIIYSCMCYILPKRCKVIACITCTLVQYRVANSRMKGSNQFPFCFNFQCSFLESMYFYTYFTDRCIFFFTTSFKTWIPYLFSIFCKSKTLLIGKKVALLEK